VIIGKKLASGTDVLVVRLGGWYLGAKRKPAAATPVQEPSFGQFHSCGDGGGVSFFITILLSRLDDARPGYYTVGKKKFITGM